MKTNLIFYFLLISSLSAIAHPGTGIVQNSKGEIYFTDLSQVWKISSGNKRAIVVPKVHTHDLSLDPSDNLYGEHLWYEGEASNKWGHFVWQYSANGAFKKLIPNTEGFRENYSFVRDHQDNMYWIDVFKTESLLLRKNKNGKIDILLTFSTTDLRKTYYSHGNIYYIDDNDLFKIDLSHLKTPQQVASDLDGKSGIDPKRKPNNNTMGIWTDSFENVYIAVASKKAVIKISRDGSKTQIYKSKGLYAPSGGLIDFEGNLWVLETNTFNNVKVTKVDAKDMLKDPIAAHPSKLNLSIMFFLILVLLIVWIESSYFLQFKEGCKRNNGK